MRQLRDLALPDLAALLGGLWPAEFLAKAPDAQAKRERICPPVTLFWAFLFQVLNPAMPCQEVVGKVRAWFISRRADTQRPALSTAAYCEARSALRSRLLQAVFDTLRVRIEKKGFRTHGLWIATTLSDANLYPAEKLAELHCRRGSIELFHRDVKTTMHREVLRTKSPGMIEKELRMHAIAYNAIRALILESAGAHQQELGRLSFKGAVDLLRQWWPQAAADHDQPRKLTHWQEELLAAIASGQNPQRPGRREPRARKRRPKNYQLLTKPRSQFQEIPHRERHHSAA